MARKQQTPPQTSKPTRRKKGPVGSVEADTSAERTTDAEEAGDKTETHGKRKSATHKKPPSELTSFNLEVAKITAILMSDRIKEVRRLGSPSDLSDPQWDTEFVGAMKRAELMIRRLSTRDYDIHAYQLFQEGEIFTEEQIANEFKRVGWIPLTSKESTMDLMADLHERFMEYLEEVGEWVPPSSAKMRQEASDAIRDGLDEIWKNRTEVRSVFPDFQNDATGFLERLNDELFTRSRSEVIGELQFYHQLFDWSFPFEQRKNSQIRRYRPHELFRLAAMRDWFSDRLVKTLSELISDFVPYPPKNLHWREFRALEKFEENARKGSRSDTLDESSQDAEDSTMALVEESGDDVVEDSSQKFPEGSESVDPGDPLQSAVEEPRQDNGEDPA